jgi:hypothetical protein
MEEKIECPRCKGFGKINKSRIREKSVKSLNPNEKFCIQCKSLKSINDFYKNKFGRYLSYCKNCDKFRRSSNNRRKFKGTCAFCGIEFMGFTGKQKYCSRSCCLNNINHHIDKKKLPNEINERLKEEGFYNSIFKISF